MNLLEKSFQEEESVSLQLVPQRETPTVDKPRLRAIYDEFSQIIGYVIQPPKTKEQAENVRQLFYEPSACGNEVLWGKGTARRP